MGAAAVPVMAAMQLAQGVMGRNDAHKASRVDEENARLSILAGEQAAQDTRREARQAMGDQLTGLAGSGLLLTGSASDLLAESEYQAELQILNERRRAYGEARNYSSRAKDTRRAGNQALIGGMFGAVSTVLGDAADRRRDRIRAQNADSFAGGAR